MLHIPIGRIARLLSVAAAASLLAVACTVNDQEMPALTGPSELSLSVSASATPNQLARDGRSQSVVVLSVRDTQGRPVSGQRLLLGVTPSGTGLSAGEVTTDAAGNATVTVTAPPSNALGNSISLDVAPVDNTSSAPSPSRTITIGLVGPSNTTVPVPSFTVTPASPEVNQVATLDASATTDEGAACGSACTYTWDLGGEATRTGRIISYQFQTARIYSVALTVTDAAGSSATTRQDVTVTAAARPTISFTVSPASPIAGQPATFTATVSVATNHRITRIDWNWGDGTTNQTSNTSINHTFNTAGTYVVTATVTDDLGQTASATNSVTVGGAATASFTFSPTNPRTTDTVQFNGSPSTGGSGAPITEWAWDFGDGTTVTESDATTTHQFAAARTYVVRLTVKDSGGRTGTTTQNVTVASP